MSRTFICVAFGVGFISWLIPFLRAKNNYRRHISRAERLSEFSFEIRHYAGREVEYFINGRRLSFLETYFAKRDVSFLASRGAGLIREYCNGRGQVIEQSPAFMKLLDLYKDQIFRQRIRFGYMHYNQTRLLAPYSYLRESYGGDSISIRLPEIDTGRMAL